MGRERQRKEVKELAPVEDAKQEEPEQSGGADADDGVDRMDTLAVRLGARRQQRVTQEDDERGETRLVKLDALRDPVERAGTQRAVGLDPAAEDDDRVGRAEPGLCLQ